MKYLDEPPPGVNKNRQVVLRCEKVKGEGEQRWDFLSCESSIVHLHLFSPPHSMISIYTHRVSRGSKIRGARRAEIVV